MSVQYLANYFVVRMLSALGTLESCPTSPVTSN